MMVFQNGAYNKPLSDEINAGRNEPADPFTLYSESIEDLILEANNFLDGKPIETEEQEQAVASILTRLRREAGAADEQRKAEKKPHDEAGKAVQVKWTPLIGKAELAVSTAKNALAAYLIKKDAAQRAAAKAATQEARNLADAAALAKSEARPDDLAGQTAARDLQEQAAAATKAAARLDKARPQATGGERAVGLRSRWTAVLTDSVAALRHYRQCQPEALKEWLTEQAQRDVNAGARKISGFTINEERTAV